jgi:hypothetical protein
LLHLLGCIVDVTGVPEYGSMGFADGVPLDSLAVMPLLRRGVRCLIIFVASATHPDDSWQCFADGE